MNATPTQHLTPSRKGLRRTTRTLRTSLMAAMGLAPLALTACDAPASTDAAHDLGQPFVEANLPADAFTSPVDAQLAPPGSIDLNLVSGSLDTGATITFEVSNAPASSLIFLGAGFNVGTTACPTSVAGVCLDLLNPALVGGGVTDAAGNATIDIILPYYIPDGTTINFQAVNFGAPDTSNIYTDLTTHPARVCQDDPFLNQNNIFSFPSHIICAPASVTSCPTYSALTTVQANQIFTHMTGQPASGAGLFYSVNPTCDETSIENRCCYNANIFAGAIGRPFKVHGEAQLAQAVCRDDWASPLGRGTLQAPTSVRERLAAGWAHAASGEHASVAAFARFTMELMSFGAPPDLVAGATAAMADEIRHARAAYGLASRFSDTPVGPGPLPTDGALNSQPVLRDVFLDVVREGCIAETLAAAEAAAARDLATDADVRSILATIADDESRHAALAWRFVRWAIGQDASLAMDMVQAVAETTLPDSPDADPQRAELNAHGLLDEAQLANVRRRTLIEVVRPCMSALLQTDKPQTVSPVAMA